MATHSNPEGIPGEGVRRIDDRLHVVHDIVDDAGRLVTTVAQPLKVEFRVQDLVQLVMSACVMALPVALTGEVWELGEKLSGGRALLIVTFSIVALLAVIWGLFYGRRVREYSGHFLRRALSAYVLTYLISFLLLRLFDQAPLDDLRVALTRTVIVAFPASFAATAVDFLN